MYGLVAEWNGRPLTLQLDHINGDPSDNRLSNLRLLCPNCHTQTSTFAGKNTTGRYAKRRHCADCGASVFRTSIRCNSCRGLEQIKVAWPSVEEVVAEVERSSYVAVARRLGTTDTSVRKYIIRQRGEAPRRKRVVHDAGVEPA